MPHQIERRRFLQSTSSLFASMWVAGSRRVTFSQSPNEQINVACIGVGGKGVSDASDAARYGNIVAICDIDDNHLAAAAETYPNARKFNDYREMFDKAAAQFDAVVVTAPDHHHAAAAVRAMRLGKHVYCQKPLTHSVAEARLLRDVAQETGVVTQMGNQGTAADGFRTSIEVLQSGVVGPIRKVHVWTNRPFNFWKQAPDIVARPDETPPVPTHVHWDLFLGPAPVRPYHPVYHPFHWRGWWDFGTGSMGDMACHTANLAFAGLKLRQPTRVSAESGDVNPETFPAWATITYEFPQRGDMAPCKLVWYEGAKDGQLNLPAAELLQGEEFAPSGMVFVGDEGTILMGDDYGAEVQLLPREKFASYQPPEPRLDRLGRKSTGDDDVWQVYDDGQKYEWFRAIQGGPTPMSNFDYAATMTEAMLLGNVAVRLGKTLEYDAATGRVTNLPNAAAHIDPPHRHGWELS